jgi:23S rRNA (adenine2503-C2)-methyltransferase
MVRVLKRQEASDGSAKYLIALADGQTVEAVYLYEAKTQTFGICLSTQAGCNMGCVFCATALQKTTRNLTSAEIVEQARVIADDNPRGVPFRYVTLAGMGEPLDNFDNSVLALKRLLRQRDHSLTEASLSSIGIASRLVKLIEDPDANFRLYLSLHAPNDELRGKLMPGTRSVRLCGERQRVGELTRLMDLYGRKHEDRWKARISYLLLKNVNSSAKDLDDLSRLLEGKLVSVQLLFWNPIEQSRVRFGERAMPLARVSDEVGQVWEDTLNARGIAAYAMPSYGSEVLGGCGQLSTRDRGRRGGLTTHQITAVSAGR